MLLSYWVVGCHLLLQVPNLQQWAGRWSWCRRQLHRRWSFATRADPRTWERESGNVKFEQTILIFFFIVIIIIKVFFVNNYQTLPWTSPQRHRSSGYRWRCRIGARCLQSDFHSWHHIYCHCHCTNNSYSCFHSQRSLTFNGAVVTVSISIVIVTKIIHQHPIQTCAGRWHCFPHHPASWCSSTTQSMFLRIVNEICDRKKIRTDLLWSSSLTLTLCS